MKNNFNDKTDSTQEWFNSKEAAAYLRVNEYTLRNMASNGTIIYYKLGKSNRYNKADLFQLIEKTKKGKINGNK